MMKKICVLIISLIMFLTLISCSTSVYATTQDDIYVETYEDIVRSNIDFNIIIQYGTPYYHNGSVLYYKYNNLYYYPYYYDNYWYVRAYRKPFIHLNYKPYFRPHKYDYRFNSGIYKGYNHPQQIINRKPVSRPNTNIRPPYRSTQPSRHSTRGSFKR